jgi:poly [ADP-ribose] polymerase 2/3/4
LYISQLLTYLKKSATKGLGETAPDEWQDAGETLENDELKGCLMPRGEVKAQKKDGGYLLYNEVRFDYFLLAATN